MFRTSREEFVSLSKLGNLIPVVYERLADLETPVSVFLKVGSLPNSFLLESVVGGEHINRYSFVGVEPFLVVKMKGCRLEVKRGGSVEQRLLYQGEDPLQVIKSLMAEFKLASNEELPPFCGGAVGYFGYEVAHFFEQLPDQAHDDRQLPDAYFVFTDTLIVFDHVKHLLKMLCLAHIQGDPGHAYESAVAKIEKLIESLARPISLPGCVVSKDAGAPLHGQSVQTQQEYEAAVLKAKEYILAGDIMQVVLSRRAAFPITTTPFQIYRALRSINPSPYMFYLQFEECQLIGSSPEMLVQERSGKVVTRPIAGTVRRGKNDFEDAELAAQLLADEKERAEHVMLVDLHRDSLGRVCRYGSIHVDQIMAIEKYSHVMHMVSNIIGQLRSDKDAYDLLRAAFPAGTLTGAPKIRAIEIIDELEPVQRGPYGGVTAYFSFNGNMDTAIILRTIVVQGQIAYVQSGGGIVADSTPQGEYQETVSKARALVRAIEMAEGGLG